MAASPAGPRTDLDPKEFRRLLEAERGRMETDLKKLDEENETGGPAGELGDLSHDPLHPADQATETFLHERDEAMESAFNTTLRDVDHALHKLETGTYGYCERCQQPIKVARLKVAPAAPFCIECANLV
jgi:DnaK suppressor protein